VLYPGPLFEALTGADTNPYAPDVVLVFNGQGDTPACGEPAWYYGLDPTLTPPPGTIALLPVVLHELVHALGVNTATCTEPSCAHGARHGQFALLDAPSVYDLHLLDVTTGQPWPSLTTSQRSTAMREGAVVFAGAHAMEAATQLSLSLDVLTVSSADASLSHVRVEGSPLLMQPQIPNATAIALDLAPALLHDLGWPRPDAVPPAALTIPIEAATIFSDGFQ
jgi:hypothetical protein